MILVLPATPQRTVLGLTRRYRHVSHEGDKSMFETGAGGKVALLPESGNSFFSNTLPVTISIVKDETAKVTHLILLDN